MWDKPIYVDFDGGCCATKRRIDLRLLVEHPTKGLFWLCIEIDENQHQHKYYADEYEESRYNDLFLDFSGRYLFLRVNPDGFSDHGCRQDPPFENRFTTVRDAILQAVDEGPITNDLVEVRHFFYDT